MWPKLSSEIHPTLLGASPPRVRKKSMPASSRQGSKQTGYKRKIFDWAMEVAAAARYGVPVKRTPPRK